MTIIDRIEEFILITTLAAMLVAFCYVVGIGVFRAYISLKNSLSRHYLDKLPPRRM